jgi:pyruvate dehydrogenase E2 component (dihydrolipoamide acetyltransferase)
MSDNKIIALTMPKWGMSMATGKVVEWLKEEGASIEKGDELLEVESEKIVNAFEANEPGVLSRRIADAGDELPVGALLGVITQDGTDSAAVDAFINKFQEEFVPEEIIEESDNAPIMVSVGDLRIAYRKIPARDDQANPPILLIHGFGGDQNSWLFNINELSNTNTVYTLDLPGHGSSSKSVGGGTLVELAESVSALMQAIDLQRAHIVGHSLGAAVAVELAGLSKSQAASLTLISSVGAGTEVDRQYIEGFVNANRRKEVKPFLQQLFANPELVNRDMIEDVLKAKRIEGAESCMRTIVEASLFCKSELEPAANLATIQLPIQIIWGKDDQIATVSHTDDFPESVDIHIIKDAGHMVHMEAASEVNDLIETFISAK